MARKKAVTYRDPHYKARTIKVGDQALRVEKGRLVVTDPELVRELDKRRDLVREHD